MATKDRRQQNRRRDQAGWSSDEDYQRSEEDWGSDHNWNEDDSSLAGEASVMSEGTEEEIPEEEERLQNKHKHSKPQTKKFTKLDLDDVGTEDDGESRHPEDITDRTERKYSKTNFSDVSDISDIEDQIAETQHKFMDEKQSLSGMIGLVDEVTMKGENLTRKASETSLVVERDTLKKGVSNDQLSLFDEDEMSFISYTERTSVEDDVPQRDNAGKVTAEGRIEYINYEEKYESTSPKQAFALGHIEYLDETKSNDSGSLISEPGDLSVSVSTNTNEANIENREDRNDKLNITENPSSLGETYQQSIKQSLTSTKSSETLSSDVSTKREAEEPEADNDIICHQADMNEKAPSEQEVTEVEEEEQFSNSPQQKEFEDPECSKFGEKHLCCFINIGGGGDDGRENGIVKRLKKLTDDIADIRKELNLARQECKKESEEVAKLIEAAAERNKAAENDIALTNPQNSLQEYTTQNYILEDILPTNMVAKAKVLPGRAQVAIPSSLLHNRLQATRQTASSTYRESLNELERMVEKEMASIKDSMIRLEPLNKIAAEWETVQPGRVRDYKLARDYKLEMVTSEMRLQAPDVKSVMKEIK